MEPAILFIGTWTNALCAKTYETLRSTLSPGVCGAVANWAIVDTPSTIVAVIPPCSVSPAFVCSFDTLNLQTHAPSDAETSSSCNKRVKTTL